MTTMEPTQSFDARPAPVPEPRRGRLGRVALTGAVVVAATWGVDPLPLLDVLAEG